MQFQITHRFSGKVLFTAELEARHEREPHSIQLGAAVKIAVKARANLAGANLAGAYLDGANLDGANLDGAYLDGANLDGANLARAYLAGAYLDGANLAGANLAGAYLAGANLDGAYLAGANLAGANLDGAINRDKPIGKPVEIDPEEIPVVPNIDAAILAEIEEGGVLDMSSWHGPSGHWCGTTHCRAGWAVHIAGKAGKALQDKVGPQMAGTLIYHASRPGTPAPHFFASDKDALEDIKKCAAEQEGSRGDA